LRLVILGWGFDAPHSLERVIAIYSLITLFIEGLSLQSTILSPAFLIHFLPSLGIDIPPQVGTNTLVPYRALTRSALETSN
jgi:hypothetical protein